MQHAVDPDADAQPVFRWIEVNIGGVQLEGAFEQQIDELRGADHVQQLAQLFAERFLPDFGLSFARRGGFSHGTSPSSKFCTTVWQRASG